MSISDRQPTQPQASTNGKVKEQAGALRGFSLAGIAQLIEVEGKSCCLRTRHSGRRGDLVFSRGRLIDASTGDESGESAALAILAWQIVDVLVIDRPPSQRATIDRPLSGLILEAAQRYDESARDALDEAGLKSWLDEDSRSLVAFPDDVEDLPELAAERLDAAIAKLLSLDGAQRVALVDLERGRIVREVQQSATEAVINTKYDFHLPCGFGTEGGIEDVLTTLADQYHLIRPLSSCRRLALHLALDRAKSNLALARHCLAKVESKLCGNRPGG